jgi:hypothetical protein
MTNLYINQDRVDFWVWINPDNWLVRHHITVTGGFTSAGIVDHSPGKSNLMFILNPNFRGETSAFHAGVTREYAAEYNLEICRESFFPQYPSRLNAVYLFKSEEDAEQYGVQHKVHVAGRILKKCHSILTCSYSIHDLSWVDFLRLGGPIDHEMVKMIGSAYWSGKKVEDFQLKCMGEAWTQRPIFEVVFLGRVEFYDRKL